MADVIFAAAESTPAVDDASARPGTACASRASGTTRREASPAARVTAPGRGAFGGLVVQLAALAAHPVGTFHCPGRADAASQFADLVVRAGADAFTAIVCTAGADRAGRGATEAPLEADLTGTAADVRAADIAIDRVVADPPATARYYGGAGIGRAIRGRAALPRQQAAVVGTTAPPRGTTFIGDRAVLARRRATEFFAVTSSIATGAITTNAADAATLSPAHRSRQADAGAAVPDLPSRTGWDSGRGCGTTGRLGITFQGQAAYGGGPAETKHSLQE